MDWGTIAAHAGASFAAGLIMTLAITSVILPASFLMNRYIYHTWLMRLMLGAIGGFMGFGAFVIILVLALTGKLGKAHYFGLFPISDISIGLGTGFILPGIIGTIFNPLLGLFHLQADKTAYEAAVGELLVKKGEPAVNEEFFAGARKVAAKPPRQGPDGKLDWSEWQSAAFELAKRINPAKNGVPLTPVQPQTPE